MKCKSCNNELEDYEEPFWQCVYCQREEERENDRK